MKLARVVLMVILALAFSSVMAGATMTFNSPTAPLAALPGQGYVYLPSCTFDSLTQDATTGLTKFTTFKVTSATWTYIGFASNAPGNTMTITGLSTNQLVFSASAAGVYRVWTTGFGLPSSVTGGTFAWAASVTTITTTGASIVRVNWISPPPPEVPPSTQVGNTAQVMGYFLTLIIILGGAGIAMGRVEGGLEAVFAFLFILFVLALLANMFAEWGF